MGRRSTYPEEFRRNAAKLALDGGRSIRDVARELGINHDTLRNWVGALRSELRDGYEYIAAEKTTYPIRLLCRVLQVSTSAFYHWIRHGRPLSPTAISTTRTPRTNCTTRGMSIAAPTAPAA